MSKRSDIETIIDDMDIDEQYCLFCEYCEDCNNMDSMPERSDEIDDIWAGVEPSKILSDMEGYDSSWDYYCFDGYGHVAEWDGIEYIKDVVDYIIDNDDDLRNDDIRDILDSEEPEEDNED